MPTTTKSRASAVKQWPNLFRFVKPQAALACGCLLRSLANSLQHCKFLDTLIVSNNAITDLKATIAELEGFQYLHNLGECLCWLVRPRRLLCVMCGTCGDPCCFFCGAELRGNPLAEEPNYRLYVIFKLPSLHVFDRHVVTQDERIAANRKYVAPATVSAMMRAHGHPAATCCCCCRSLLSMCVSSIGLGVEEEKAHRRRAAAGENISRLPQQRQR